MKNTNGLLIWVVFSFKISISHREDGLEDTGNCFLHTDVEIQVLVLPWKSTKMVLIGKRGLIAHTSSLPHCPLSQGFSWIFYICCLQWDVSPSPTHCVNEDKALWIKSVKCFAPITDLTKVRLNSLSPHTYVCIVSAQKCSFPLSESADLNGPLHSRLHKR